MQKIYSAFILFFICFLLASAGHAVFLFQWTQDHYMVGIDDGLSQMMPFKQLLYEQYTNGEFFYSFSFGLGAGTFSELSYYFSTSIVFLVTVAVVFFFETLGIIHSTDVLFWANAAVFISIVRLSFVLFITARIFMYMKISRVPAILGASIYGISGMYFRHVVYWEFFADAFLWLPLLILGIEKIFREGKHGWFLAAVSISLIDNFYFAYVNFLLAGLYILARLFIPLSSRETTGKKALASFLIAGLIGFGISAVSFVPAVYAYLNNHRPPFTQDIALFDLTDNILFSSRFVVFPAIFVVLLFSAFLYHNKTFRLFAVLGMAGILLHNSPLAASAFNGFSAPQFRWEYFLTFVAGGAIAVGLEQLGKFTWLRFSAASFFAVIAYIFYASADEKFELTSLSSKLAISSLLITLVLLFCYIKFKKAVFKTALIGFLFVWVIVSANVYQIEKLLEDGNISEVNKELLTGSEYDDPEIRELLDEIHDREDGNVYRIDWMEGVRNNTPIVQNFRGVSAYSSILNKNLLYFYLYDLEIDMGRESVSRYATLGNRANLHSLLQGKYIILPKGDGNAPFGFKEVLSSENYSVYENGYLLPFARSTSAVYSEKQFAQHPPLVREHAMLTGVVLDGEQRTQPLTDAQDSKSGFTIEEAGASFENGVLDVHEKTGGIDLIRTGSSLEKGDLYVSFHLEHIAPDDGFPLEINEYHTTRKPNDSIYRTFVDDITIRIPADDVVKIRVPEGKYKLTELQLHEEDYELLMAQSAEKSALTRLDIDGSLVEIDYSNAENDRFLTVPIPYEIGWRAFVNGKETDVLKANYAFIAVPIEEGKNEVTFIYRPPFFKTSVIISVFSLFFGCWFVFRKKRLL